MTVMTLKKANSIDIDKLRTVVLFDSEANHTNKWIGQFTMEVSIRNNKIAPEQYSRPGRSTIHHALNCRLTFDHNAFKCTPFALTCTDLKSCYNRVVHAAVSLAFQWLGLPIEFILGMLDSIHNMVHNIWTGFGNSSTTCGSEDIPAEYKHHLQGLNQENGAGRTIWSIVSSVIFEILQDRGYGSTFISSISKATLKLVGFSCVDNCDLFNLSPTLDTTFDRWRIHWKIGSSSLKV